MNREDIVILYLTILLSLTQWFWIRAEKRAAYLDGRASVYAEFAADAADGTCYAAGGCAPTKKGAKR